MTKGVSRLLTGLCTASAKGAVPVLGCTPPSPRTRGTRSASSGPELSARSDVGGSNYGKSVLPRDESRI